MVVERHKLLSKARYVWLDEFVIQPWSFGLDILKVNRKYSFRFTYTHRYSFRRYD